MVCSRTLFRLNSISCSGLSRCCVKMGCAICFYTVAEGLHFADGLETQTYVVINLIPVNVVLPSDCQMFVVHDNDDIVVTRPAWRDLCPWVRLYYHHLPYIGPTRSRMRAISERINPEPTCPHQEFEIPFKLVAVIFWIFGGFGEDPSNVCFSGSRAVMPL